MLGKLSKYLNIIALQPPQYKFLKYMYYICFSSEIGYSKNGLWKFLNPYYSNDRYAYSYPLFRNELIFAIRIIY